MGKHGPFNNTREIILRENWEGGRENHKLSRRVNWRFEESMKRDNRVTSITAQAHEYQVHGRIVIE